MTGAVSDGGAVENEGNPQLRLNVDYERAWATVKQALQRASIEVVEIRQDEGVFFVHIVDDSVEGAESEGWFKRMIPGGADGLDVEIRMTASDGSGEDADSYLVAVFEPQGDRVPLEVGQQILVILREFAT